MAATWPKSLQSIIIQGLSTHATANRLLLSGRKQSMTFSSRRRMIYLRRSVREMGQWQVPTGTCPDCCKLLSVTLPNDLLHSGARGAPWVSKFGINPLSQKFWFWRQRTPVQTLGEGQGSPKTTRLGEAECPLFSCSWSKQYGGWFLDARFSIR